MADSSRGRVLITGASAGLGEAFARAYARRGRDLILIARRQDRLERLAHELREAHGVDSLVFPANLATYEAWRPIVDALAEHGAQVHTLVNNAGFGIPQDYVDVPWERQRDFLMTLVVNACGLAWALIPQMLEARSGAIINVASVAAFSSGAAGNTLYPAAKSFAVKFSQSLDAELRASGVKVTALCPGFTRTEFSHAAGIHELMEREPRMFWQTAKAVVETAIRANDAGRVVVVPGLHNKLAAAMMKYLPESLTGALIRRGAAKYRIKEQP
jgi:short-subunit dehydrogenase